MSALRSGILIGLLAGCAQTHDAQTSCPAMKDYSPQFMGAWATALVGRPDTDPLVIVSGDYIGLRDQVRACRAAK